jgi:hypothetical protein
VHIILDTNIVYDNWHFDTPKFEALLEYLNKTKSMLVIPKLVKDEIIKKYGEKLSEYIKFKNQKERNLLEKSKIKSLDENELVADYKEFLSNFLKKHWILDYPELKIEALIARSISECPPFGRNGKGFRDTIIWETIVELLKRDKGKNHFCFITNNSKDFGAINLHNNLRYELSEQSVDIEYFNDLESFIGKYGEAIKFIDEKLISEYINSIPDDRLIDLISKDNISDAIEYNLREPSYLIQHGDIDSIEVDSITRGNYYIYKSNKDSYFVNINFWLYLVVSIVDWPTYHLIDILNSDNYQIEANISIQVKIDKKTRKFEMIHTGVNNFGVIPL